MSATYVARATALIDQKRFPEAEGDLRNVIAKKLEEVTPYTMYQAYERLAVSFTQQRKLSEAASSVGEARTRLPQYSAALTDKLAVILYQGGQKNEALSELNGARAQARVETLPESRLIFYRLGQLNVELGRRQDAGDAFREFLSLTQGMLTPDIKRARSESEIALRNLFR
jgi:predicted negative regulator of RcsB-dependent stress response